MGKRISLKMGLIPRVTRDQEGQLGTNLQTNENRNQWAHPNLDIMQT